MLACTFLSYLSPVQLTKLLTKWADANYPYLNPVWLNNDGQNIVAFLPKKAFYLQVPNQSTNGHASDSSSSFNLQLKTVTRDSLPSFINILPSRSYPITEEDSDPLLLNGLKKPPSNEANNSSQHLEHIKIQLSNNQSIETYVNTLINESNNFQLSPHKNNTDSVKPRYYNGYIGYIGYDVSANELANSAYLKKQSKTHAKQASYQSHYFQPNQPAAYFGHYPIYLSCQLLEGKYQWQLHANDYNEPQYLDAISNWLQKVIKVSRPIIADPLALTMSIESSYDNYKRAFNLTQAYLQAGDCYQINLTQAWQGVLPLKHKLVDYLPKLHTYTDTPFSGYIGIQEFELLSCSPELFVTFSSDNEKQHIIETKPIKGTMPRGSTAEEDAKLKAQLASSEKDLAENVMIVDLLRNDLGKYAQTGTVKVPKRFAIESFNNVHHMVSTITATLKEDVHPLTMLFESLPAGSITGTPKKRAVEIINELEQQARGAYCGTMGYMNFHVSSENIQSINENTPINNVQCSGQWNVLIRTLQAKNDNVSLWAGGGITISSKLEDEYQECWDKVNNIIEVLSKK